MTDTTDILNTIQTLRAQLNTLEARLGGHKAVAPPKEDAAPKPKRVASEGQLAWISFIKEVQADMEASGWTHPETGKPVSYKDAMQEASKRRAADPNAPKPKPKPAKAEASTADGEPAAKPKRVLSDEQKAKMAAGRKAAAERRKAEKAAAEASTGLKVEIPPIPDLEDEGEDEDLERLPLKGRQYLRNKATNGCWLRTADGAKGDWAGVYDPKTRTIDTTADEP
jgi:hypothetical protein